MRDHIFISYAGEDAVFVEWLSLRLAAEGYKVWCDRIKLLGGESYPRDIDAAIKERTSRFLAVLSRHSIAKANPVKERTLALSLARERKENFVIPVNLDGLSATDLDWMTSDLTFIPFHLSWAGGLAQLLKQFDQSSIPREFSAGRSAVSAWLEAKDLVVTRPERLWGNVAEVLQFPRDLLRYEINAQVSQEDRERLFAQWPHVSEGDVLWSFVRPATSQMKEFHIKSKGQIKGWKTRTDEQRIRSLAVRLLGESIRSECLRRGLKLTPDKTGCYFPDGLFTNNRLPFVGYDGKITWIAPVGVKTFKTSAGKERNRYHLAPVFRIWLDYRGKAAVQIRLRLFITTLEGVPLEPKPSLRRRKAICKNWWNYEWLARVLAMYHFLAGGEPDIRIGRPGPQQFRISKRPFSFEIDHSLDESVIEAEQLEAIDAEEIELPPDEEKTDNPPADE